MNGQESVAPGAAVKVAQAATKSSGVMIPIRFDPMIRWITRRTPFLATWGRVMIEITFVDNKRKEFSTATKYDIIDDWYVLMDDDGQERGRAQASKVRDIEQVDEDESGPPPLIPIPEGQLHAKPVARLS